MCAHDMKNGTNKTGMGHSDYCRRRIMECLRGTEAGRRRLETFGLRNADGTDNPDEPNREDLAGQGGMDSSGGLQDPLVSIPAFEPLARGPHDSAPAHVPPPPTPMGDDRDRARGSGDPAPAPITPNVDEARERMEAFAQRRERRERALEEEEAQERERSFGMEGQDRSPMDDRGELAEVSGEMDTGIVDDIEEDVDLREIVQLYNVEEREAAVRRQREILSVVESLGGDRRAYGRERARKARAIISELYSPPRISALARELPQYGIAPGLALDLTTTNSRGEPWDFSKKAMRDEAERLVDEQAPLLLVGTPMCTAFSTWQ